MDQVLSSLFALRLEQHMIVRPGFVAEKMATTVPRPSRQVRKADLFRCYTSICAGNGVEPVSVCNLKLQAAGKWSTGKRIGCSITEFQETNPILDICIGPKIVAFVGLCVPKSETFVPWCPLHMQSRVLSCPGATIQHIECNANARSSSLADKNVRWAFAEFTEFTLFSEVS